MPSIVKTTTTQPAITLSTPIFGTDNVPFTSARPTAKLTITPVSQIAKLSNTPSKLFFAIYLPPFFTGLKRYLKVIKLAET